MRARVVRTSKEGDVGQFCDFITRLLRMGIAGLNKSRTLGDIDVGAGETIGSEEVGVHVDAVLVFGLSLYEDLHGLVLVSAYRIKDAAESLQLGLHALLLPLQLGKGKVGGAAVGGPRGRGPRRDGRCVEIIHSQRQAHCLRVDSVVVCRVTILLW